jgi:hypothetical protein
LSYTQSNRGNQHRSAPERERVRHDVARAQRRSYRARARPRPPSTSEPQGRLPRSRLPRLLVFPSAHTHRGVSESPRPRVVLSLVGRLPAVNHRSLRRPGPCATTIKGRPGRLARAGPFRRLRAAPPRRHWHAHAELRSAPLPLSDCHPGASSSPTEAHRSPVTVVVAPRHRSRGYST